MTAELARRWVRFTALGVGLIFIIFPLYWMILTAFTPRAFLFRPPTSCFASISRSRTSASSCRPRSSLHSWGTA